MEKHQFGFGFIRWDTGGEKVKSFWGQGANVDECRADALRQAKSYKSSYEAELNAKARAKAERRAARYAPTPIQVGINGVGVLWR